VLEFGQEQNMMTAERPPDDAALAPPPESAALAEWFDDPEASEELQALRAWVAGLSNELAQARRERDEVQQALYAALAEIAQLREAIAQADLALPLTVPAAPAGISPLAPGEPAEQNPASSAPGDAVKPGSGRLALDDSEITAELIEAWGKAPAASDSPSVPETRTVSVAPTESPGVTQASSEAPDPAGGAKVAPVATAPADLAATAYLPISRSSLAERSGLAFDEEPAVTRPSVGTDSRRVRLLAAAVLLLVVAAAVAIVALPRLTP
jgi:hypothetical protein